MKNKLFLLFIFLCNIVNAQTYQWAGSAGTNHVEAGRSVATDGSGNVYVVGYFQGTSITFGSTTLTNTLYNKTDMYIVKYDAGGNVLWAKREGGNGYEQASSITTDQYGNVLVTGTFNSDSITFSTSTLHNVNPSGSFTLQDVFIVKYDAGGNLLWAKSGGSPTSDFAFSIACDLMGNAVIAVGGDDNNFTFGTVMLSNLGGLPKMIIVKYDANGNALWARNTDYYTNANSVDVDNLGNSIAFGYYTSPSITFGTTTLTNLGYVNMFLVKYDVNGTVLWANNLGGNDSDYPKAVAVDTAGNIIAVGYFGSDTLVIGADSLFNASNNNDDMFIVKYDANGNVLWAKSAGGSGTDRSLAVTADISGNILVTGSYYSPSITFDTDSLTYASDGNIYIVKYNANGNVIWLKGAGGSSGMDLPYSIAVDSTGDVLLTGDFWSSILAFGSTILTNQGDYDMFVVKLGSLITRIDNEISDKDFSFFPNPSNGEFTIEGKGNLEIYNTLGEKIYGQILTEKSTNINLQSVPGIYFLKVAINNEIIIKKLIKE